MSAVPLLAEPTFRDPKGRLYAEDGRILREVYSPHGTAALSWLGSPFARRAVAEQRLVATEVLERRPDGSLLLEHERIFFPTYPWEWSPGQWMEAASLTLSLCEEAVGEGLILKDATPLNVLFRGPRAVFVDVLSFEPREAASPLWLAWAQFVRTFLLPLAAYRHLGWPLSATLGRRDGYEPRDLEPFLSLLERWRQPLRSLVTLPLLLEKKEPAVARERQVPEEVAAFALRRTLRLAGRMLRALAPPRRASRWSAYTQNLGHYQAADQEAKRAFVGDTLGRLRPARVLDVGANTGFYSRLAAAEGAQVVAWDTDVEATDIHWRRARAEGLAVLPLVADFARPTPAAGWGNRENLSLLDRAGQRFDCVLMLGILHHLLVADQIPLGALIDQLAAITTRWAILEWVPRVDVQFRGLCRGREELYDRLTTEHFLATLSRRFALRSRLELANGRTLCLAEKL